MTFRSLLGITVLFVLNLHNHMISNQMLFQCNSVKYNSLDHAGCCNNLIKVIKDSISLIFENKFLILKLKASPSCGIEVT